MLLRIRRLPEKEPLLSFPHNVEQLLFKWRTKTEKQLKQQHTHTQSCKDRKGQLELAQQVTHSAHPAVGGRDHRPPVVQVTVGSVGDDATRARPWPTSSEIANCQIDSHLYLGRC